MLKKFLATSFLIGICVYGYCAYADELQEISQAIMSTPDLISKGKTIFMNNCSSCHGSEGRGDGPAAAAFNPKPRNFTAEKLTQGSSPSAAFYMLTNGLGSMPSFSSMPAKDRLAVVHFILSLSPNREKDTLESLAKIGLDPSGKPLVGFKSQELPELPVEFIIERMASDGNSASLNYKELEQKMAERKEQEKPKEIPVVGPNLKHGKVLFESCKTCHGSQGEGNELARAPQIAGQDVDYIMSTLKKFQTGVRGAHPEDGNGLRMRPMSRLLRNEEEVSSVAHYIGGLAQKKPKATFQEGDPEKGRAAFVTCIACHGPDAKGMKAMNAPGLVNLQDWYLMTQIHNFKAGYRGMHPGDTTGATMRGMAMSIANDQMVKDIAAYLQSLQ